MPLIEELFVATTLVVIVTGLAMVAVALRAYAHTTESAFIYLALGFVFVVAAAASTAISALWLAFGDVRSLLMVNSGFTMVGYFLVIYSLVSYGRSGTASPVADGTAANE